MASFSEALGLGLKAWASGWENSTVSATTVTVHPHPQSQSLASTVPETQSKRWPI